MEALQQSLDTLAKEFDTRMAEFQQSLNNPSSNPNSTVTLAADFSSFKKFVGITLVSLQKQISLLMQQQDVFEMRSRRKMLLLHGVPDSKQEDTTEVVVKIVSEKLKIAEFTSSDLSRCHRLGKSASDKPRSILVKFTSLAHKERVWFAKPNLKGSGFTLSEFLTKSRHEAFMLARQQFGVNKTWTRDGNIHIITPDGARHRVSTLEEVRKVVSILSETAPDAAAESSKTTTSNATATNAAGRSKRTKK